MADINKALTAAQWKKKIKKLCIAAGTYRDFFDPIIDTLAQTLERRDKATEIFIEKGAEPVIVYTNKGGQENLVKNPCMQVINELNTLALNYWRDLGLTPKGFKAVKDVASIKDVGAGSFNDLLKALEDE